MSGGCALILTALLYGAVAYMNWQLLQFVFTLPVFIVMLLLDAIDSNLIPGEAGTLFVTVLLDWLLIWLILFTLGRIWFKSAASANASITNGAELINPPDGASRRR